MSVVGAIVLLVGGLVGLTASWNAARPVIDPTRRYSPAWLPAMVISELAPFWLLVHLGLLAVGALLGGTDHGLGRVGVGLLMVAMALLLWIVVRTMRSVRRLRSHIAGPIHAAPGRAKLVGRPIPTPDGVLEELGIEWHDGLTCDLTRPAGGPARRPVVVYVHGGGWTGGDPQRQARDLYHALARDGWATVAVRYPFTPDVSVELQIDTIRRAVRWARVGLAEHGVVATSVVLAGGSAGAHLATMASFEADGPDERVAACIGIYGIYDMANRHGRRATWHMIPNRVMRATVAEAPHRYDAVSPLVRIPADSPPMLIVHGGRDTLVPIGEAEQFVAALRAANRPVDFVRVDGAQHAFDAVSSPITRATAAVIRTWLDGLRTQAARPT